VEDDDVLLVLIDSTHTRDCRRWATICPSGSWPGVETTPAYPILRTARNRWFC